MFCVIAIGQLIECENGVGQPILGDLETGQQGRGRKCEALLVAVFNAKSTERCLSTD